jgi:L-alanine-DL-glutamate epimerase-like enolase superfamily enzyme
LDDVANLYGDGVIPKDGHMILSDRPGLGIELNEKAVADLTLK